ncbi:MAG: creatininase family protein [Polyangiaceae bacterium]|nr:creatininase family protein [Polyangiaceae bacterium]
MDPLDAAPIRRWHALTGADFAALDRARTIVLVTFSPIEVHGPHLPVAADVLEGDALLLRSVGKLRARMPELEFVHVAPFGVGAQVLPHPGSLPFDVGTVERVLYELGRALALQGFVHVWVGNFHGGPGHFLALERAAWRCNRAYGTRMIALFSLLLGRLDNEHAALDDGPLQKLLGDIPGVPWSALAGDAHAGTIETSLLLHLTGAGIPAASYRTLPRRTFELRRREQGAPRSPGRGLRAVVRDLLEKVAYFGAETYAGDPAIATAEAGAHLLERLSDAGADALAAVMRGEVSLRDAHSPIWRRRWLLLNPLVTRLADAYLRRVLRRRSRELAGPPRGTR